MLLSIILPTHNMACFLPEAIQSIINNTFKDIEVIIINDGSTDHTAEVVRNFKEKIPIRYYKVAHRGKASCINEILNRHPIRSDYIVFMDADDTLPENSLQMRYDAITATSADIVIGEFIIVTKNEKQQEVRKLNPDIKKQKLLNRFFYYPKTPFHLNGTIISKQLFAKTGRFDETLKRGQEVDYAIRLLKTATRFSIFPEVVYHYRKYYRPLVQRVRLRFQTMYYRIRIIHKHFRGIKKVIAMVLQLFFDLAKLVHNLVISYK